MGVGSVESGMCPPAYGPRVLEGERDGWRLDGRRARTDGVGGGERKPIADPPRWWGAGGLHECSSSKLQAQASSSKAKASSSKTYLKSPSSSLELQAWSFKLGA